MPIKTKVAVLGANGQIGSVLIRHLSRVQVVYPVAICRNALGAGLISDVDCDIRQGSVTSDHWDGQLIADCDSVINCIWGQGSSKSVNQQNAILLRNVRRNNELKKFISLSTVAVYGSCIDASWSSFDTPKPDISYAQTKMAMENMTVKCFADSGCRYHLIRLGHVYGSEQWLSRMVIESILDNKFRLPFDGRMPSNAVHVDEVAQGLIRLLLDDRGSGVLNLASHPQRAWRQIFDWHSYVCGLPQVKQMDHNRSMQYRKSFIANSRKKLLGRSLNCLSGWLRSISPLALLESPDVRALGSLLLDRLPVPIERRVKALSAIRTVRAQINASKREASVSSMFCCDAMPGKYLELPPLPRTTLDDSENDLREWYKRAIVGPIGCSGQLGSI